jgi:hypothetical protein
MPGTVIGKTLSLGFAGKVSRNPMNKIRSRFVKSILDSDGAETMSKVSFGKAVVLNTDNTYSLFGQSGTGISSASAVNFAGISVSEVKQSMSMSYGANNAAGEYEPGMPCDALQIGTTSVFCTSGTPDAGGKVYIVTAIESGAAVAVGDFVASSSIDSATVAELPNCRWTTGKQDSSGLAEIEILYQVQA